MMVTTDAEGAIQGVATPDAVANVESVAKRHGDNRRSNKPIMEKRRRARINNCLNELKTLILDAMKKDPARHSKLEKADILEMTVKHLQNLQRQQAAAASPDASVLHRYRAGFSECATEVGRFPGLEPAARRRLLQHLATCLGRTSTVERQVQVRVQPQGIVLGDGAAGVQLLPTRLPNGDIALVLPGANVHQQHQGVPLLVPIVPERTNSTGSATSSSNYSPIHSPEPAASAAYSQSKPLSLVVRKPIEPTEEKPWRPW